MLTKSKRQVQGAYNDVRRFATDLPLLYPSSGGEGSLQHYDAVKHKTSGPQFT